MKRKKLSLKVYRAAEEDLNDIIDYISTDSINAALKTLSKFDNVFENIIKFPIIGKIYKHVNLPYKGYRYVILMDYLIFYKVENDSIAIYRIINGARDYSTII